MLVCVSGRGKKAVHSREAESQSLIEKEETTLNLCGPFGGVSKKELVERETDDARE